MKTWDTETFFVDLLTTFGGVVKSAMLTNADLNSDLYLLNLGENGFRRSAGSVPLGAADAEYLRELLISGELSDETVEYYGDGIEPARAFICYAHGALLGKRRIGEIDGAGFMLGQSHLVSYSDLELDDIQRVYEISLSGKG